MTMGQNNKKNTSFNELSAICITDKGVKTEEKDPYDPKFVAKIRRAEKQKGTIINPNDVWGSLRLK